MEDNTPKIISRKEAKAQGLTRYFTGEPCKHGHVAERMTSSGACHTCLSSSNRLHDKTPERQQRLKDNGFKAQLKWNRNNREKLRKATSNWTKANKEAKAVSVNARRRRCRVNGVDGIEDIKAIYKEAQRLNQEAGHIAYHIDHIIPLAKGGAHHPDNLQILSAEENLKKGDKLDLEKVDNF